MPGCASHSTKKNWAQALSSKSSWGSLRANKNPPVHARSYGVPTTGTAHTGVCMRPCCLIVHRAHGPPGDATEHHVTRWTGGGFSLLTTRFWRNPTLPWASSSCPVKLSRLRRACQLLSHHRGHLDIYRAFFMHRSSMEPGRHHFIPSSEPPNEVWILIVPILQTEKLRHRVTKSIP